MVNINEMYLIFDKNNELVKNYITTSGLAQCNRYGCISLKQIIDSLKTLLKTYKEIENEIDLLEKEWEKAESEKSIQNEIINIMLGRKREKETLFTKKYKELYIKKRNILYSYTSTIDSLITKEEQIKIIRKNGFIALDESFINKTVELLESKEV